MINLGAETKLSPDEVLSRASQFFGPTGVGLAERRDSDGCLTFIGGGGHVSVTVSRPAAGGMTDVAVQAQEWERDATRFLAKLS